MATDVEKVGWRTREWARAVGVSRSYACQLIAEQKIRSVKIGAMRIVVTSPAEYLNCAVRPDPKHFPCTKR